MHHRRTPSTTPGQPSGGYTYEPLEDRSRLHDRASQFHMLAGLPVPELHTPAPHASLYCVATTVDRCGRLADGSAIRLLGWESGRLIAVSIVQDLAVVASDTRGPEAITGDRHLRLRAPARRQLRLRPGDRVLLVTDQDDDLLVVYPPAAAASMIRHRSCRPPDQDPDMSVAHDAARASDLAAARLLLDRLGVTAEQLLGLETHPIQKSPTFNEYLDRVADAVSDGTRRAYGTYWRRIRIAWGQRHLNELTPLEISQLVEQSKNEVVSRRNGRDGRAAAEHLIAALRCVYKYAIADGLIAEREIQRPGWRSRDAFPIPAVLCRTIESQRSTPRPGLLEFATTTSGAASASTCRGWRLSRLVPIGCGTRR
jgi:hypothetical protein